MAKFEIKKFRWLFQDMNGDVWNGTEKPYYVENDHWGCGGIYDYKSNGDVNFNWRDTLIDLDKDDYEFEDGVLRRIEKNE